MSAKTKDRLLLSPAKKKQFSKARKDFEQMQAEIAPYTKIREIKQLSTAGGWYKSSSFMIG